MEFNVGDKVFSSDFGHGTIAKIYRVDWMLVSFSNADSRLFDLAGFKNCFGFPKNGTYTQYSIEKVNQSKPMATTFNIGDKVQLKKEFYKERTFKLLEYYRKQSVGKMNGKELTITAICRPDFCVKIGETHVYTDLLEKVEKPVVKSCCNCGATGVSVFTDPCKICTKSDWSTHNRPLWHSATEKPVEKVWYYKDAKPDVTIHAESSIKVGDWVQAKTSSSHGNVIKGEKYQVIGFGHTNEWLYIRTKEKSDLFSIPEKNIGQPFGLLKTDMYVKCDAPEPQYREVKRVAKPGEKVRIVEAIESHGRYKEGDIITLIMKETIFGNPYYKDDVACFLYPQEYVVLEPITKAKRVYTAEQIAEANRLSKRLLCECFDKGISITWHKNGFDVVFATKYDRFKQTQFSAKCSENDEFNLAVGKMVAICKACAEPMPKWVHGA